MTTVQRTMCSITVAPLMNQFVIFLYYHFLDYFERLACTLPCLTFLTPFFHIFNTFITLFRHRLYTFVTTLLHICYTFVAHLLHPCYTFVTPLLHICNTRFTHLLHFRCTVVTLIITILMYSYSVAFCPVFVLWHFVRV